MPLWYNPPKGDSKFATLGGSLGDARSPIQFAEARIIKDGEVYILFGFAESIGDIQQMGEKSWKFTPQLVQVNLHSQPYTKKSRKGNDWVSEQVHPTLIEKFLVSEFEANPDLFLGSVPFKGLINLENNIPLLTSLVYGKGSDGKELPEAARFYLKASFIAVEPTEAQQLTEAPVADKKGFAGGMRGQTEAERLAEKMAFLKRELGQYAEGANSLVEIALSLSQLERESPELHDNVCRLLSYVMG